MTTKSTRTWVLILSSVASLMVALDALVVSTALSTIRLDLGASIEQLEWTVNAYNLSFAVLLLTGGATGARLGRRRVFAGGLALFVAASAACALAPDVGTLIAARAVQGAGAAAIMPMALVLLSANFPTELRGRAMGLFSGITGLAVLSGPVVGGAIAQGAAWEWIFWLNVPIGLVAIPLVLRRMPESFGARARIDVAGLALVTGAALGVVWGLVRGNSAGWGSLEVVGSLVAGIGLGVAFVAVELRARAHAAHAAVPLPCLRGRQRDGLLPAGLAVRSGVLRRPVPADRTRLRAAGRWAAAPAVDGDAVLRRPDRRVAAQPARRAPADRHGAHPAGGRHGVDRGRRRPERVLWPARPRIRHRGRGRVDGAARGADCRDGRGRPGRGRQGVGHVQHHAPARRRVRDRSAGRGVRGRGRLCLPGHLRRRLRPGDRRQRGPCGDRRGDRPGPAAPARSRRAGGRAGRRGGVMSRYQFIGP